MKKIFAVCIVFAVSALPCLGAEEFFGVQPKGEPSVINYAWDGMTLGAMLGLSAGYLQYVDGYDTRKFALDTAYGALAGTGVGLVLGMADVSRGSKGYGAIALKDMNLGGRLGMAVGALWGTANALKNNNWENLGKGAAWGFIGGSVAGLGIAFYEGPKIADERSGMNLIPGIGVLADSGRNLVPCAQVASRF